MTPNDHLNVGQLADNWHRFRDQWQNYVIAANPSEASSEKRAAVYSQRV